MTKPESRSRRRFLKAVVLTTSAIGIGLGLSWRRFTRCPSCTATIRGGHRFAYGTDRGIYCPNCGIELVSRRWRLDTKASWRRPPRPFGGASRSWEVTQVPFPSAARVERTPKATVVFSRLTL